jgi:dihydrofolate reductase
VSIGGGANVINQYLAAGLVDEMNIHIVPIIVGSGARLLNNLAGSDLKIELIQTVAAPTSPT